MSRRRNRPRNHLIESARSVSNAYPHLNADEKGTHTARTPGLPTREELSRIFTSGFAHGVCPDGVWRLQPQGDDREGREGRERWKAWEVLDLEALRARGIL